MHDQDTGEEISEERTTGRNDPGETDFRISVRGCGEEGCCGGSRRGETEEASARDARSMDDR
jgi:hypothetical protein